MLIRTVGLLLGLGLVSEGLYAAINPKGWSQHAAQLSEEYLPEPVKSSCLEYTRLSPDAIRLLAVGELVVGWMMLRLAKR